MAVGIDFLGPSILVLAAERLGALDISICYAADALSAADATAMADLALAALSEAGTAAQVA
jgi:hypothetical protein